MVLAENESVIEGLATESVGTKSARTSSVPSAIRAANDPAASLHEDALTEIRSAAHWCVSGRGSGRSRPPGSPRTISVCRRLLEAHDEVRVLAVMHGKRRPGYWLGRLKK